LSTVDFVEQHTESRLDEWLDAAHPHVVVYVHHSVPDLAFAVRYKSKVHYYSDRYYWWANNYTLHAEYNFQH
jgi:hypothetical protein